MSEAEGDALHPDNGSPIPHLVASRSNAPLRIPHIFGALLMFYMGTSYPSLQSACRLQ